MDSSGLLLLLKQAKHARENGWNLQIDREIPRAVKRAFKLSGAARFLGGDGRDADPAAATRTRGGAVSNVSPRSATQPTGERSSSAQTL
jgi:anti-anti-sigma regulatory factor